MRTSRVRTSVQQTADDTVETVHFLKAEFFMHLLALRIISCLRGFPPTADSAPGTIVINLTETYHLQFTGQSSKSIVFPHTVL